MSNSIISNQNVNNFIKNNDILKKKKKVMIENIIDQEKCSEIFELNKKNKKANHKKIEEMRKGFVNFMDKADGKPMEINSESKLI